MKLARLSIAIVLLASAARAQVIIQSADGTIVVEGGEEAQVVQPAVEAPAETTASTGKSTPRSSKLKSLQFDRRPSAILAAWSTPPKPKEEEAQPPAPAPAGEATAAPEAIPVEPQADEPAEPLDPEAQKKADEAKKKAEADAEKKRKAEEEKARKTAEAKALDEEIASFQRNVTLGDWAAVKSYLASLTDDEKKVGYDQLLKSLQKGPSARPANVQPAGLAYVEKNRFAPADVLGLAAAAPQKLTKEQLTTLGQILRQALDAGHQLDGFVAELKPRLMEEGIALDRRQLALVLVAANEALGLEELLPTAEQATQENDREALNLLSRCYLAHYDKDKKAAWLEKTWSATQAVLALGEVSEEAKAEAIKRAVDLAPKIQKELGQVWLDESFTTRPERGMEILAAIGSSSSTSLATDPADSDKRFKLLRLQTTAAKALLASAPERASDWRSELSLLAGNWLREANVTYQYDDSTSLGPRMQRDTYGNYFYWDPGQQRRGNVPTAIRTAQMLEIRPSDEWLDRVDATLQPRVRMVFAQLLLKVGEDAAAFPYIEQLAASHPRPAKDLVDEFLRVWTKNHDPNAEKTRTNPYFFIYGFEERANGIPLTRSKQTRNLRELGEWIVRLRKLPVELDVELVANAFTSAHSTAEVYRLETVEEVFGPIQSLDPATLAGLVQKMRANLAGVWRDPALQEKKKTNRHQKDIEAEVMRGYELARATLERALLDHPKRYELVLAKAALEHDENNYRGELGKDSEFSARRASAFETFHEAAALYAEAVESLAQEKETIAVFETWFYAALGACDLKAIDPKMQVASSEIPRIRTAIAALPGERAERHASQFASALLTRMSSVNPGVKFRYVREGLEITGEHELTREARALHDYYKDLVTEIQLRAAVDGSDRVGHAAPFGVRVDLRHTREIERESGGFSKYLQNQNNQSFAWNYGRPLEDYRDKFEEAAREALEEHFEVLSITFNDPKTRSHADGEYGWRVTPYAYLLLKPRGAQVDRVPPLHLDLDFLDTTGYAVIPVESAAVPIDAREPGGDERPFEELRLTQVLDERQAKDGKLLLEVKASAFGLVPELDAIADIAPAGFDVVSREDHGVSVVKFDEEGRGIVTERTWTITTRAKDGLAKLPDTFAFGAPKVELAANETFRYDDADLVAVESPVSLEREYGRASRAWMWWIPVGTVLAAGAYFLVRRSARSSPAAAARYPIPEPLTPFTVLSFLREIRRTELAGAAPERDTLDAEIQHIERHFFMEPHSEAPDLRRIAERWAARAG